MPVVPAIPFVLGAGRLQIDPDDEPGVAVISAVMVEQEMRGRGVGTALMRAAEDMLWRRGIAVVELGVHDTNPGARRLYERLGYGVVGRAEYSYDTVDAGGVPILRHTPGVRMRKQLSPPGELAAVGHRNGALLQPVRMGERVGRQTVGLLVRTVSAGETHDLRRRVLRDGRVDVEIAFPEDDEPDVLHLALADGDGDDGDRLLAVASFIPAPTPLREGRTFQLRGMAVEPAEHGRGRGRVLLEAGADRLRQQGVVALWANVRDSALGFYQRLGWEVVGDTFVYGPMALAHHVAVLDLTPPLTPNSPNPPKPNSLQ